MSKHDMLLLVAIYLLVALVVFVAAGGFRLFRRANGGPKGHEGFENYEEEYVEEWMEEWKERREEVKRERRGPGLLPKGYSHVERSREEERDMDAVRERFRKDEEKRARAGARRAYYDSLYDN